MFRSVIAAVSALLASAAVQAQSSQQCTEGKQEILYPAANTNITQLYGGRTFPFKYCSGAFLRTAPQKIQVVIGRDEGLSDVPIGVVVGEATFTDSNSYTLNLTYPGAANHIVPPPNAILVVLETYRDGISPMGVFTRTQIPLSF